MIKNLLFFIILLLSLSTIGLLSLPIAIATPIGKGGIDYTWKITKTGDEEHLEVEFEEINETQTEFCIGFSNEIEYKDKKDKKDKEGKDLKNVPIVKIKGSSEIGKVKLDLEVLTANQQECFIVNHPINTTSEKFKIGWESVEIDGSASINSIRWVSNENLCRDSTGKLHTIYEGGDDDLWYANSTDDGITWSKKELLEGTVETAGILCMSNDTIFIYYESSSDIEAMTSYNNGETWSSAFKIESDLSSNLGVPACILDSQDYVHCVYIEQGVDTAYYTNTTQWETATIINDNSGDDSDLCDIEVDDEDCVYIGCVGTDQDDIDFWSNCLNGYGDVNRVEMFNGASALLKDGMDFDIENDHIYVAFVDVADLQFCNSSTSMAAISCQELDSSSSYQPTIAVNNQKEVVILYTDSSTSGSRDVVKANSTDGGITWSVRVMQLAGNVYSSIADSTNPSSNRFSDTIRFVANDEGSDVNYDSFAAVLTGDYSISINQLVSIATTTTTGSNFQNSFTLKQILNLRTISDDSEDAYELINQGVEVVIRTSQKSILFVVSNLKISISALTQHLTTLFEDITQELTITLDILSFESIDIFANQDITLTISNALKTVLEKIINLEIGIGESIDPNFVGFQDITQEISVFITTLTNRFSDFFLNQGISIFTTTTDTSFLKVSPNLDVVIDLVSEQISIFINSFSQSLSLDFVVGIKQDFFGVINQGINIVIISTQEFVGFIMSNLDISINAISSQISVFTNQFSEGLTIDFSLEVIRDFKTFITQKLSLSLINMQEVVFFISSNLNVLINTISSQMFGFIDFFNQNLLLSFYTTNNVGLFRSISQGLSLDSFTDITSVFVMNINQVVGLEINAIIYSISGSLIQITQRITLLLSTATINVFIQQISLLMNISLNAIESVVTATTGGAGGGGFIGKLPIIPDVIEFFKDRKPIDYGLIFIVLALCVLAVRRKKRVEKKDYLLFEQGEKRIRKGIKHIDKKTEMKGGEYNE